MPRELRGTRSSATASWIALFTSAWLVMIGGLINCARPAFEMEQACAGQGHVLCNGGERLLCLMREHSCSQAAGGSATLLKSFPDNICVGVYMSIFRHCSDASGEMCQVQVHIGPSA